MTKTLGMTNKDTIFQSTPASLEKFNFNKQVVDVFPDMINRSVPGYQDIIEGIGTIAHKHLVQPTLIYDLGCSLGSASLSIAKRFHNPMNEDVMSSPELSIESNKAKIDATSAQSHLRIVGVDNSLAMIERCRQHVSAFQFGQSIDIVQSDIFDYPLQPCDMVVMNFTLQFIDKDKRQTIINKVYDSLSPGGIFILSEKLRLEDPRMDKILIELHHDFKRSNGYSELEIAKKRSALEDVMILDSPEAQQTRLKKAGFSSLTNWFQQFNFYSLLAVK